MRKFLLYVCRSETWRGDIDSPEHYDDERNEILAEYDTLEDALEELAKHTSKVVCGWSAANFSIERYFVLEESEDDIEGAWEAEWDINPEIWKSAPEGINPYTYMMIRTGELSIEKALTFMSKDIIEDIKERHDGTLPKDTDELLKQYGERHKRRFNGHDFVVGFKWVNRNGKEKKFFQGDDIIKQKINDGEKRAIFTFDLLRDDGSVFDTVRIRHDGRKRPIERFIKKNNYVIGEECEIMIQGQMMKARLKEIVIENYY